MIIRTSCNTRFFLGKDRMVETGGVYKPYYANRLSLKHALETRATTVPYFVSAPTVPYFVSGISENSCTGWIQHGVTQRKKKFISIGCMRFVGVNRARLIRWAKSAK